jgi:hypothetical protein
VPDELRGERKGPSHVFIVIEFIIVAEQLIMQRTRPQDLSPQGDVNCDVLLDIHGLSARGAGPT